MSLFMRTEPSSLCQDIQREMHAYTGNPARGWVSNPPCKMEAKTYFPSTENAKRTFPANPPN